MKSRVVFDASSLVGAAIRPGSIPDRALQIALGSCEPCVSAETLAELNEVLHRKRFDRYVSFTDRMAFLRIVQTRSSHIAVSPLLVDSVKRLCRDVKDEKYLALCLAAEADILISSDQDLLILNPWNGIPILTPAEFLAQAESSES
jgi:putative PIN family toxin of toxin-antitoxin system